jgi:hypothetical protein
MPIFTNGWVNVTCRKTLEARPLSHPNPLCCLLLILPQKYRIWAQGRGVWTRVARGGSCEPSQCCRAWFWAGDERSYEGEEGNSNQTPSPQAAISINHAHHACSSMWRSLKRRDWGEAYHPLVIARPTYILKSPDLAMGPKHPLPCAPAVPPPTFPCSVTMKC